MNKYLSFGATTALTAVGFAAAFAATRLAAPPPSAPHPAALTAQQVIDRSVGVVQRIKADARFSAMLKDSKGVLIIPVMDKGAFARNNQAVDGILLKQDSRGHWTQPAFLKIESVSLDARGKGGDGAAAMLLMSDKAMNDFAQANNLALNGGADLKIADYAGKGAAAGQGDVVVWADQTGPFAGVNVGGAQVTQDATRDRTYYGKQVQAAQILQGGATNPGAKPLTDAMPS